MSDKREYKRLFFLILLIMYLSAGCAGSKPQKDDFASGKKVAVIEEAVDHEPKIDYYEHRVVWMGETISIISGWYTGDILNWKEVADANPEINPKLIRKGDVIRIPKEMMTTEAPLPKSYVDSFYPVKEETSPTIENFPDVEESQAGEESPSAEMAPPASEDGESLELFGPK